MFHQAPPDAECASFYSLPVKVATPRRASKINSRTCAWHDPGAARPAGCSPSAEYAGKCNAPDAQRLQSATCRKQPGARRCRRAAGGRCVTICSFFPSYFRPSFSPPSLSREHRPVCTYVRASNELRPASDGSTTDTYAQFSGASRTDARPRVPIPRRGHANIAAGPATEFRQTRIDPGRREENGDTSRKSRYQSAPRRQRLINRCILRVDIKN